MQLGDRVTKKCKRYDFAGHVHEFTFSCYGNRVFLSKERTCQWLVESLDRARSKFHFSLWGYVFMPNHVHLLIRPSEKVYSISTILKEIKQPVGAKAIHWVKNNVPQSLSLMATGQQYRKHRFWQKGGGYDRNINRVNTLISALKYIHNNPIRKKLVSTPQDWYYSSASEWLGFGKGPLKIDKEDWPTFGEIKQATKPSTSS